MEESIKYYYPEISDIRVGYTCETRLSGREWVNLNIEEKDALYISSFIKDLKEDNLRTPYLTKEQIVAEGWELLKKVEIAGKNRFSDNNFLYFSKGKLIPNSESFSKFNLRYKVDTHEVHIISKMRISNDFKSYIKVPTFYGKCPSINEFRIITKLLGI